MAFWRSHPLQPSRRSPDQQSAGRWRFPTTFRTAKNSLSRCTELFAHGQRLFTAVWTSQEGGGRPLTKGTGNPLTNPTNPLVFPETSTAREWAFVLALRGESIRRLAVAATPCRFWVSTDLGARRELVRLRCFDEPGTVKSDDRQH